jgi:hypothetical protein
MEIQVEPVTINFEECYKLRLDGTLFGVFWTNEEAIQYAESLKFNIDGDPIGSQTPMRTLFKKALKKQPALSLALLDASNEEPGKILGRIVNLHRTRSMALIDEMDFAEGTMPRPKTRIVTLKNYMPVGSVVTP